MTSPGIKGPPTVESGCGEGNRVAGDGMGGIKGVVGIVAVGVGVVVLVVEVARANAVVPADLQPAARIAHIINGVNIRKNLIFILVS